MTAGVIRRSIIVHTRISGGNKQFVPEEVLFVQPSETSFSISNSFCNSPEITLCVDAYYRKKSDEQRYESMMKDDVSNTYHRLIRYVKPPDQSSGGDDGSAAFRAHVDSTFLTLIPALGDDDDGRPPV